MRWDCGALLSTWSHSTCGAARYNRARALDPKRAAYVSNAAAALLGLGRRRAACQACCEAVALDPSFVRPRQRLATLCSCAAGLEEALEVALALSEKRPSWCGQTHPCAPPAPLLPPRHSLPVCLHLRLHSHALRDLVEQMAAALQARADGAALFARGRYREAQELYTAAIERVALLAGAATSAPGIVVLYANRASTHGALDMFHDALRDCDAACALAPDDNALAERRTDVVRALNRASAFGLGQGRAARTLGKGEQTTYVLL